MPKVSFSSENKVQQDTSFPVVKLGHKEQALIAAIESEPTVEYVHTLRAPAIGPDGRVIKEERRNEKTGETFLATKMEFFGQHLCFGDFSVVSDKGTDPENCPTCRAAADGMGIEAPKPRYAMHVIRYGLQPNSWNLREPFSVTCEAWVFPAGRFNRLVDIASEWNLAEHDLKLGPCENKDFQKYDTSVSSKCEWRLSEERQKIVAETYKNNRAADLSALIGRKVDKSKVLEDLARVQERLDEAYNTNSASSSTPAVQEAATHAVADSVSEPVSESVAATKSSGGGMTLDDLFSDL